jgi:molybdate transport system ATP-binding protein
MTVSAEFRGRVGAFPIDAAFNLPARGLTALSGPSGAGKSTVLRCLAGLTRLAGALTVDGEVWQDVRAFLPPHRRAVGMVFQDAGLLSHLSVRGNLLYGARRAGPGPFAQEEVIDLLGLATLLHRATANLSGGERQRVAIGRALLSQPRLLLMDEPLSSLDADSKAEILPYLERLPAALGLPILYVSHDAAEIARLASRVVVMRDGRTVETREAAGGMDAAREILADLGPADRDRLALAALAAGLKPAD